MRLLLALVMAAGLVAVPAAQAQSQAPLTVIRAVGPPNDGFKAVFYGVKSGIFKKYGLDVQTSIVASGAAAAAALSGGAADIAYTNILTLIQAWTHSVPMVFVAPGNLQKTGTSQTNLLVLSDSPIKTGKDMNGKTLGSSSLRDINSAATFGLDRQDRRRYEDGQGRRSSGIGRRGVSHRTSRRRGRVERAGRQSGGRDRQNSHSSAALRRGWYRHDGGLRRDGALRRGATAMRWSASRKRCTKRRLIPTRTWRKRSTWSPRTAARTPDVVAKSVRFIDADYLEARYLQPMIDLCAHYQLIDKDFPAADVISSVAVKPPR